MLTFETELRKIIDAEINRLKDNLASGQAAVIYERTCGEIFAYRRVLADYIDEATTEVNKR